MTAPCAPAPDLCARRAARSGRRQAQGGVPAIPRNRRPAVSPPADHQPGDAAAFRAFWTFVPFVGQMPPARSRRRAPVAALTWYACTPARHWRCGWARRVGGSALPAANLPAIPGPRQCPRRMVEQRQPGRSRSGEFRPRLPERIAGIDAEPALLRFGHRGERDRQVPLHEVGIALQPVFRPRAIHHEAFARPGCPRAIVGLVIQRTLRNVRHDDVPGCRGSKRSRWMPVP